MTGFRFFGLVPPSSRVSSRYNPIFQAFLLGAFAMLSAVCLPGEMQAQTAQFSYAQSTVGSGLSSSTGVAVDGSGNIYIADNTNGRVLKVPSTDPICATAGDCTTVGSNLNTPTGVAVDGSGNVYIADPYNNRVLKVPPTDQTCATAGDCTTVGSGLNFPYGVAVDGSGNVYIADYNNNRVLKVPPADQTCATAGDCTTVGSGLKTPSGATVDSSGNVYIADSGNNRILKVPPTDQTCVTTGDCTSVGTGLSFPTGVATDGSGNVYIADYLNNRVLKVPPTDPACTTASDCTTVSTGLKYPEGVAVDGNGNIYIADSGNKRVLKEQTAGVNFNTVAVGTAGAAQTLTFTFDTAGNLNATTPYQVLTQGATGLDFADAGGGTCASMTQYAIGATCTVNVKFSPKFAGTRYGAAVLYSSAGTPIATGYVYGIGSGPQVAFLPGAMQPSATLGSGYTYPIGVAVDGSGNVYVADAEKPAVYKMPAGCSISSCMTSLGGGYTYPVGVAVDGAGNVYVADFGNLNPTVIGTVDKVPKGCTSASCVTSLGGGFDNPNGVAVDGSGNVFITDFYGNEVKKIPANCMSSACVTALGGGFSLPAGVAVDGSGNVYVVDYGSGGFDGGTRALEMPGNCSSSSCVTMLGGGFLAPYGVAVDASGNIYVADFGNSAVKEMPAGCSSSNCVTTLGSGFKYPSRVTLDSSGNVYVADTGNLAVKELNAANPPTVTFPTPTIAGTTDSTDGPQTVTLENIGNAALSFPLPTTGDNPSISTGFTLSNSSTCPQLTTSSSGAGSLAAGTSCTYLVSFAPTTVGSYSGSSLVLTNTNLNANPSTTQTISLDGTGTAGPVTHLVVSAPSTVVSDTQFTVTVTAEDAGGNVVTTYAGPVNFSTTDSSADLPNASGVTWSNGVGTTTIVRLDIVGSETITAADSSNSNITGTSGAILVTPGPATYFEIDAPATSIVGVSSAITIEARDLFSNLATSYNSTVTLSSSDGAATLPSPVTLTGGTATFNAIFQTTGTQTVSASGPGNGSTITGVSGNTNVIAAPVYNVTVLTDTTTGTAGNCVNQSTGLSSTGGTDNSNCSLRDAVAAVDGQSTGVNSIINFTSTLGTSTAPGTITLANGSLTLTENVSINGLGTTALVIDGNLKSNIFIVNTGVSALLQQMTLQNAQGFVPQLGGAIDNAGSLSLIDMLVQNNKPSGSSGGAGIYNTGSLAVTGSTLIDDSSSYGGGNSGYGGGILNLAGSVVISTSTLAENGASESGGNIYSTGGSISIQDSTITGSNGTANGGGLSISGGTVTVTNSTIASNYAGNSNPGVQITGGTITVTNSIVAGNGTATSTGNCPGCTLVGNNVVDVNPLLSVLGSYGGPTQTLVPLPGSPAICTGTAVGASADQRGYARPAGSCYDIGAVQTLYTIAFPGEPTTTYVNAPIETSASGPLTVQILDHGINGIPGAVIPFTLTGNGALSNGSATTDTTGTASYSDATVNTPGTGDTLTAVASSTAAAPLSIVSSPFNVLALTTQLAFAVPPAATVPLGGNAGTITVNEEDASGTIVTSATDNITLTVTGPDGYSQVYMRMAASGVATFNLSTAALPNAGSYTYTASFGSLTSAVAHETVMQATTTTVLTSSSAMINPNQTVTLTATVTSAVGVPTGSVAFSTNGTALSTVMLNNGVASLTTSLPAGTSYTITAVYSGDTNYLGSSSGTADVTVAPLDFTFTDTGANAYTVAPGVSAIYNFAVTPLYGSYAGTVSFTVAGLPAGATATFTPDSVAASGGPTAIKLTVQTSTPLAHNSNPFGRGVFFALLLLPFAARRKVRARLKKSRLLLSVLLLAGLAGMTALTGCGSNQGFLLQPSQTYSVTVTATSGTLQHTQTVSLNVQ